VDTPLKQARTATGKSQGAVAADLGINQGHYCRIEHGDICPAPGLARRIAKYFGDRVSPMEILDPEYYMHPNEAA
jgi:DNA-binding XRE family transcriptional regulator